MTQKHISQPGSVLGLVLCWRIHQTGRWSYVAWKADLQANWLVYEDESKQALILVWLGRLLLSGVAVVCDSKPGSRVLLMLEPNVVKQDV